MTVVTHWTPCLTCKRSAEWVCVEGSPDAPIPKITIHCKTCEGVAA